MAKDITFMAGDREMLKLCEDGRMVAGELEIRSEPELVNALRTWLVASTTGIECPNCGHSMMVKAGPGPGEE